MPDGYIWCKSVNTAKRTIAGAEEEPVEPIDCDHDPGDLENDGGDGYIRQQKSGKPVLLFLPKERYRLARLTSVRSFANGYIPRKPLDLFSKKAVTATTWRYDAQKVFCGQIVMGNKSMCP